MALVGCRSSEFLCGSDAQCVVNEEQGFCESNGYCSFDDDTCESGRRYGELAAGTLANQCTQPTDAGSSGNTTAEPVTATTGETTGTTTTTSTTSPGPSTTATTDVATDTTLGDESSEASDTTEAPRPGCGNGIVEPDEACDDGNEESGDGCSATCSLSGEALVVAFYNLGVEDECSDVDWLNDEGPVLIGYSRPLGGIDARLIIAVDEAGTLTWVDQATTELPSRGLAIDVGTGSGDLYVGGYETAEDGGSRAWTGRYSSATGDPIWQDQSFGAGGVTHAVAVDPAEDFVYYAGSRPATFVDAFVNAKATSDGNTTFSGFFTAASVEEGNFFALSILGDDVVIAGGTATFGDADQRAIVSRFDFSAETVVETQQSLASPGNGATAIYGLTPSITPDAVISAGEFSTKTGQDGWAAQVDTNPVALGLTITDGLKVDSLYTDAVQDDEGTVFVTGSRGGPEGQEAVVSRINALTGATEWTWTLPDGASGSANALVLNDDGHLVVCGVESDEDGSNAWLAIIAR